MDTTEAAAYLGLKPATLIRWRLDRRGPTYTKIGNRVKYLRSDLDTYVASRRVESQEPTR
jgi:excisionase family DNA binding protein